jgi:hypothetical protein
VYPNPASDYLTSQIEPFLPETHITIYDLSGRVCYKTMLHVGQGQLSLNTLKPSGVYILCVENAKGKAYLRMVMRS